MVERRKDTNFTNLHETFYRRNAEARRGRSVDVNLPRMDTDRAGPMQLKPQINADECR